MQASRLTYRKAENTKETHLRLHYNLCVCCPGIDPGLLGFKVVLGREVNL